MTLQTSEQRITTFRSTQQKNLEVPLDEARKRLIETGTRNRLVNTNRSAKKPATLSILSLDASALCDRVRNSSSGFRFVADPIATERERTQDDGEELFERTTQPATIANSPLGPDQLQTRLGVNNLSKKLLKFATEAKTLEEEQGINILYLAFGFLRWYEDEKSTVIREAPLILVPVSLKRDVKRSSFVLNVREDDISVNLPLSERLAEMGIKLPEPPESDSWKAQSYFNAVLETIKTHPR